MDNITSSNYFNIDNFTNKQENGVLGGSLMFIMLIWVLAGFIAFIMSIICFGKSGSTTDKIIGLLLAIFFGPFYFLFYGFNSNYCR